LIDTHARASVESRSKVNGCRALDSPVAHHRLQPEHRNPIPGSSPIIIGAAPQFHFAIEKPNRLRVAKLRDDLAIIVELRQESHVIPSFRRLPPCHPVSFNSGADSITYFAIQPVLAFYELLRALPFLLKPVSSVAEKVGNFTTGNP
jgi:hypothetical protein